MSDKINSEKLTESILDLFQFAFLPAGHDPNYLSITLDALNHNNEIPFRICTHLPIVPTDNTNAAGTCSLWPTLPIGHWSNLNRNYPELRLHYV